MKIAIIGGGSAYAPGLVSSFIKNAGCFPGAELCLMDIAPLELEIVRALAEKMVRAQGVDLSISATLDQQEAIQGADYVLTSFRQGGFEARHQDERLPLKHGVIGQETVGPGGFFFAMRTLPVIKSILADIQRFAPGALLLNYTNPTQIVAEAVTHFSSVPCLSLCDQTRADGRNLLQALGIPHARLQLESVGLNHATWSTLFEIDGQDGIQLVRRELETLLSREDISPRLKRQCRLAARYGRLPNSYLQYYYFPEETLAEARAAPRSRAQEIMAALPGMYQHFREQGRAEIPQLKQVRGGSIFGDMAVEVLCSLVTNDGRSHTLNIPNRGALPQLDADRIVEAPANVENGVATPISQAALPAELVGLLLELAEYQRLAAVAIWNGGRRELVQALASNPLVGEVKLAEKMLVEVLQLQREYFPDNW